LGFKNFFTWYGSWKRSNSKNFQFIQFLTCFEYSWTKPFINFMSSLDDVFFSVYLHSHFI
jgi:hypothetical protein